MVTLKKQDEEDFEVLDLTDKNFIEKIMADLTKAGATKQLAVGAGTGWATGWIAGKLGRVIALTVGGTLLIAQYANYKGYISINWGKLERTTKKKLRKLEAESGSSLSSVVNQLSDFVADNVFLAGGFAGGFLIGIAT